MESLMAEIIASSAVAKPQTPTFAGAMPQTKTVVPPVSAERPPVSTPTEPPRKPAPTASDRTAGRQGAPEQPRRPSPERPQERRPAPAPNRRPAPAGDDDLDVVTFVPSGRRPSANPRRAEQPIAPPRSSETPPPPRRRTAPPPPPQRAPGHPNSESYRRGQRARLRTNLLLALVALAAVVVIIVFVFQNFGSPKTDPSPTPTGTVAGVQPPSTTPSAAPPSTNSTPLPTPSLEPSPTLSPTPEVPEIKYEVYIENVSWQRAKERAAELGGHLVTISDAEEYAKVVEALSGTSARYIWLGAQRGADGAWTWENGESIDFFKWYAGEPSYLDTDGTPENCLMLWRGTSGAAPEWAYNDMRANPVGAYPQIFGGVTAFIVEYE